MDNYKIAFIYGTDEPNKKINNGKIQYYGLVSEDYIHTKYLLDYINEYYSEIPIFKQLNIRHQRELIAYFLVKMGHIVFFNTTPTTEKEFQKYGKTGQFMMPDTITEEQNNALNEFCKEIKDYDILINYDITLEDGLLDSKTIIGTDDTNPEKLIQNYKEQISTKKIL